MAPGLISFDEALALIESVAKPLGTDAVALEEASARVLARSVVAQIDSPRCDVSAMDGYAVRDADLSNFPAKLLVVGKSYAGCAWDGSVRAGTCVRIFTGAPVPSGADRVVIQENVTLEGDSAVIETPPGPARHIRGAGSDFRTGDTLLSVGRVLDPRAMVAAAGADLAELEVYGEPRLYILSTGDELAVPGTARRRVHAVPESVSFGIAALARQWGARCIGRTALRDDLASMRAAAVAALEVADIVVVTGGASVGEKDFAKAMFEPLGMDLIFSKVSMKPGKPVWLGRAGETFVVGLPGNPTSAMVTARLLLAPLLAGLSGRAFATALSWDRLPLATPLDRCGARETFHRARLVGRSAEILSFQDSSAQRTLAGADLLVRQAAHSEALETGREIQAIAF